MSVNVLEFGGFQRSRNDNAKMRRSFTSQLTIRKRAHDSCKTRDWSCAHVSLGFFCGGRLNY